MNWEFIVEYLPLYEKATVLTVRIGLLGIAFAILVGFACAMVQYHRIPVVRQIVAVYIELSRNTPLLVRIVFHLLLPDSVSGSLLERRLRRAGFGD